MGSAPRQPGTLEFPGMEAETDSGWERSGDVGGYNPSMWDERYSEPGYAYGTEPNGFLASVVDRIPEGRVLCLAEGEGRNAVFLAGRGYDVTAVDASSIGLTKANKLAAERGVTITTINADLTEFDIEPDAWQGIVSIFCHLPPLIRAGLHERCLRGLAPGAVFVLEAFTPRQLDLRTGGPRTRELLMELDFIRQELPGLRFEIAREIERPVEEGKYHRGTAAVLEILAVKDSA